MHRRWFLSRSRQRRPRNTVLGVTRARVASQSFKAHNRRPGPPLRCTPQNMAQTRSGPPSRRRSTHVISSSHQHARTAHRNHHNMFSVLESPKIVQPVSLPRPKFKFKELTSTLPIEKKAGTDTRLLQQFNECPQKRTSKSSPPFVKEKNHVQGNMTITAAPPPPPHVSLPLRGSTLREHHDLAWFTFKKQKLKQRQHRHHGNTFKHAQHRQRASTKHHRHTRAVPLHRRHRHRRRRKSRTPQHTVHHKNHSHKHTFSSRRRRQRHYHIGIPHFREHTTNVNIYKSASILMYRTLAYGLDREYLFGEEQRRGWSDFGGGRESADNHRPLDTALREYHEESKHMLPTPASISWAVYHRRHVQYLGVVYHEQRVPSLKRLLKGKSTVKTEKSDYAWVLASDLATSLKHHPKRSCIPVPALTYDGPCIIWLMKAMVSTLRAMDPHVVYPQSLFNDDMILTQRWWKAPYGVSSEARKRYHHVRRLQLASEDKHRHLFYHEA